MAQKARNRGTSVETIMEDMTAAWRSRALSTAIDLEIFTHIAGGKRTVKEIAAASGASVRGTRILLDALAGMNYLKKNNGRYALPPLAATFLVREKPAFLGDMAQAFNLTDDVWKNLTDSVKSGLPQRSADQTEKGKDFFPKLVGGIFPGSFVGARAAVASLPAKERSQIRRILDVAAGSGAWSLAFAQAIPEARVTAVDLPQVIPITREFAQKFGIARQYDFLEGDMRLLDFGRGAYDLAILGHILHSEGETHARKLLSKCYGALRPGGLLLIAEFIPNDARTGPTMPLLFGLNMLLNTEEGNVFTIREYRAWLMEAGFRRMKTIPAPGASPLILATK